VTLGTVLTCASRGKRARFFLFAPLSSPTTPSSPAAVMVADTSTRRNTSLRALRKQRIVAVRDRPFHHGRLSRARTRRFEIAVTTRKQFAEYSRHISLFPRLAPFTRSLSSSSLRNFYYWCTNLHHIQAVRGMKNAHAPVYPSIALCADVFCRDAHTLGPYRSYRPYPSLVTTDQ